jgi:UDP-N-acetylglucosamine--N-acetylmuramyl-(pentapeptide) pyrophosphoryl-undecaprenol N-acetylglucosamine transferase
MSLSIAMVGGGTGGHVIPALAVAGELRDRGHQPFFIGTERGLEAKLAPASGFPIEWIEIGGLKSVGIGQTLKTLGQLPSSVVRSLSILRERRAAAMFSMGGYAAGPPMIAARLCGMPALLMEPNAVPGLTSRWMARAVARALISFPEAATHFPPGKSELTGLPVRAAFFAVPRRERGEKLAVLITGGSQGSRRFNQAARESWPQFAAAAFAVRLVHQTGPGMYDELSKAFVKAGLDGEVVPFIEDMAGAFAGADLVVCRSGAGAVSELAAAGRPSILVPFPFAADQHQLRNAEAMVKAGAARLVPDAELTGRRLFEEVAAFAAKQEELERMGEAARSLARPGAARRAADLLEELARRV